MSAQQTALKALKKVGDTYRASPVGLFTLNTEGRFIRYNPALASMLGYPEDTTAPIAWREHFESADLARFHAMAGGDQLAIELCGRMTAGSMRWYQMQAAHAAAFIEGSLQDITDRRVAEDRLRFLADHDPLTELLNRRGIEQVLEQTFSELGPERPAALAYLDLDRFKLVNDLYGHPVGDEVLRQVTGRVAAELDGHPFARVGGDEFVIVFADTAIDAARQICQRVIGAVCDRAFAAGERLVRIEGSIGLIEVAAGMAIHDAIATADRACRDAKRDRGGRLVVYEHNAAAFADRAQEIAIIQRIAEGAVIDGLFIEMQPIMSLSAPFDSLNFEVLLRLRDRDDRLVPTVKLIHAAETSGLMPVIDRWVMRETLTWLEAHAERLPGTRFVCLNLSGVSLNDERFVADTLALLADFPRAAPLLCFEITETVALHDLANTRRWIDKLRRHGVKVALDDFGAGYTSFSYLRDLPADALKIDGAFIRTINQHAANYAIVQVIVELAANLGMKTIAEWAEDRQVLETLAGLGADYAQGWAVARPQAPAAILNAESAASFIHDEATIRTVQDFVDKSRWGAFKERLFPLGSRAGR